ncbi:hypothetical protein D910_00817 [Dendroctonus ponderosae]|uniref:Uncharacterized protein n=1 Tax=Dendroctonus ponderosae TaxID=77166 RepID=U4U0T3_DENPD|nr:hypothetical protein D910_00817 [Dendroctonus ponderosae]
MTTTIAIQIRARMGHRALRRKTTTTAIVQRVGKGRTAVRQKSSAIVHHVKVQLELVNVAK